MKKILTCLCFLFFFQGLATGQPVAWDSTYRPDIYQPRVALFKSLPCSRKDVVFLGNSLTFWADWSELLGSPRYKNRGIPGDTTFGVLERLDDLVQGRPEKVFILIGINDLARNIPDSVIVANYRKIIQRIKAKSPSTRIIFQTMLPTNDSFSKLKNHYNHEEQILAINTTLKAMAKSERIEVLDLFPHFADAAGKLKKEYTWDGVHLTLAGYARWAKILKDAHYVKRRR